MRFNPICGAALSFIVLLPAVLAADGKVFKAGAAAVDVSPDYFPVIVNGSFTSNTSNKVVDPLYARALVLDDGETRLAIMVVDNCMLPRKLLDEAKALAAKSTGIPAERILISATHTHSAPSAMGALGTPADPKYPAFVLPKLVEALEKADAARKPAKLGWAVVDAAEFTNCRRWVRRPDRLIGDPYGKASARAHMHPGHLSPDVIGPAGPVDPDLSLLAVQGADGKPLAVLSNYSMHYYGATAVSSDYFGQFCKALQTMIGGEKNEAGVVAIMSNGTCGDLHWMDYGSAAPKIRDYRLYAQRLAQVAYDAFKAIKYADWAPLAMAETKLTLNRRVPDAERLAWAKKIVERLGDKLPAHWPEVYAKEALYLHEDPTAELKLQAVKVGTLGIVSWPNEVFGISGLKIKMQSPLQPVFNIELANGAEGYIPPPEQHKLGGYTTWPARTAGLEVQAEPKIVEQLLQLLEKVAGAPRKPFSEPPSPYSETIAAAKPAAYFRMGEMAGPAAVDAGAQKQNAIYEDGVVFYLEGPAGAGLTSGSRGNRAAHFAGGRMKTGVANLGENYSVEFWFWNGLAHDARPVAGYLFSRGADGAAGAPGEHLGIGGGTDANAGKLLVFNGNTLNKTLIGKTALTLRRWYHVALVREGKKISVYLDGNPTPEISDELEPGCGKDVTQLFFGGRSDNLFSLEGKLDEAAVFTRALTPDEIAAHYKSAGVAAP